MKAYIDIHGNLIVVPENNAEHYVINNGCFEVNIENEEQKAERLKKEPTNPYPPMFDDPPRPWKIGDVTCSDGTGKN